MTSKSQIEPERHEWTIEGMGCASCVGRVEKALLAVPGVEEASVNLATERAQVCFVPSVSTETITEAIGKAGYQGTLVTPEQALQAPSDEVHDNEAQTLQRLVFLAAALTLPVFVLEMGSHMIPAFHHWVHQTIGRQTSWYLQFGLTTLVLAGPGSRFFTKGIPALLRGGPDMNSLVALGAGAAYLYSTVATFFPSWLPAGTANVYFESAAVIATLILVGKMLEHGAKGRTSEAIRRLLKMRPKTALVQRNGEWVPVPWEDVQVGDIVQVHPGEQIPIDGVITKGSSFVDEAMMTGEPIPVEKAEGDEVIGSTINKMGSFQFRVTRTGADTVLSQIVKMVQDAQGAKLPIQTLVNRITLWFVPTVMALAFLTGVAWAIWGPTPSLSYALVNAVAVLIIACPCAMGLATPTSIMVGTGRAAELGVLFRKGEALQQLQEVKAVAFDKTGTLTTGQPTCTEWEILEGFDENNVLSLAASAEQPSEHPIARAIVQLAQKQPCTLQEPTQFEAISGKGIKATIDGTSLAIGSLRWLESEGISFAEASKHKAWSDAGSSIVCLAIEGKAAAMFAVSDTLKPSAQGVITQLKERGLTVAMITGDMQETADAIAKQAGIDTVVAEVLPDGKVEAIQHLQQRHGAILFVGDGINDAPALATADVGLAIGTGTDIAIESADVVLMSDELKGVAHAISLSQATVTNIKQNLFWAFVYNVSLIPIAAGLLYPINGTLLSPMVGAGAMALSSLFVLGNALRLKSAGN